MAQTEFRLVFLDAGTFGDVSFARFTARWESAIHTLSAPDEIPRRLAGYDAAIVNKVVLDRSIIESPNAKDLKLIAVAATGTDNVDLEAARRRGVRVCNVPGYATQSVAQFTMAVVLELATRACGYRERVRQGAWQKSPMYTLLDFPSFEIQGKALGIVGYGNIGRAVAEMAKGFGMEVLVSHRPGSRDPTPPGRVSLNDLLARADIVTLHCPLTSQTRHLINSQALALMKPTAYLVNTARGGLVDESALIQALRQGRLAGAALDVLTEEPPSADHPMIKAVAELDNLFVTPHCAWTAREARQRLMDEVAENILAFTEGRERNRVVRGES